MCWPEFVAAQLLPKKQRTAQKNLKNQQLCTLTTRSHMILKKKQQFFDNFHVRYFRFPNVWTPCGGNKNTTLQPLIPWFPPTTIWSLPKGPRHRLWLRIWGRYCYPAKASACTLPCPFRFTSVGFCKTQKWCPNSPWKNIDVRCATHIYVYIYRLCFREEWGNYSLISSP